MDIDKLQRNSDEVFKALNEDGDTLVARKACKIYVPEQFFSAHLGVLEEEIRIMSIFAIVVDDKYYAVSNALAMMQITPTATVPINIKGTSYYEFGFEEGDVITPNVNLIQAPTLAYRIYDMFIAKGKIPWYLNYSDIGILFTTAKLHADANLGVDNAVLEMIVSSLARDPKDRMRYYRHSVDTPKDTRNNPPDIIPLRSVALSTTNTTAKLLGNYMQEGVTSALVSPTERSESIETMLRK